MVLNGIDILDCTQPFVVDINTDNTPDDAPPSAIIGTSRG